MWQGFIKCCEVTKPQSFPVLLQLPTQQLKSILEVSGCNGHGHLCTAQLTYAPPPPPPPKQASPILNEALQSYLKELSPSELIGVPRPLLQLFGFIEENLTDDGNDSLKQKAEKRKPSKPDYDFAMVQQQETELITASFVPNRLC